VAFDLVAMLERVHPTLAFRSLDRLMLTSSSCKLRRIFTLRNPLVDDTLLDALERKYAGHQ
jgi:hypothetical protein